MDVDAVDVTGHCSYYLCRIQAATASAAYRLLLPLLHTGCYSLYYRMLLPLLHKGCYCLYYRLLLHTGCYCLCCRLLLPPLHAATASVCYCQCATA